MDTLSSGQTRRNGVRDQIGQLPMFNRSHWVLLAVVVCGLAIRFGWFAAKPGVATAEAAAVAISFANGGGLADAYFDGQGPTAHLLPISPGVAGIVYAIAGVRTLAAETILACWSIILAMCSALFWYSSSKYLNISRNSRIISLVYIILMPAYINLEVVDFRIWEGGLAAFLMACTFNRAIRYDVTSRKEFKQIIILAILSALSFFVNPLVGLACYFSCALYAFRNLDAKKIVISFVIAVIALSCLIVPWALRNEKLLGAPIVLRSNAGIELAISMYPGAEISTDDDNTRFFNRMKQIHPYHNPPIIRKFTGDGEYLYSAKLQKATISWMLTNPHFVAIIVTRHFRQIFLPSPSHFRIFALGGGAHMKAILVSIASLCGIFGLLFGLFTLNPIWLYLTISIFVPSTIMMFFQPIPRYTYLIYFPLCFCAGKFIDVIAYQFSSAFGRNQTRV